MCVCDLKNPIYIFLEILKKYFQNRNEKNMYFVLMNWIRNTIIFSPDKFERHNVLHALKVFNFQQTSLLILIITGVVIIIVYKK